MNRARRILLATLPLVGCGAPIDSTGDEGGADHGSAASSDGLEPTSGDGEPAPDYALLDVNPNSSTHDQSVSPRDYLEQVSGWYFAHAT